MEINTIDNFINLLQQGTELETTVHNRSNNNFVYFASNYTTLINHISKEGMCPIGHDCSLPGIESQGRWSRSRVMHGSKDGNEVGLTSILDCQLFVL